MPEGPYSWEGKAQAQNLQPALSSGLSSKLWGARQSGNGEMRS